MASDSSSPSLSFTTPPPPQSHVLLSTPAPHVLLVTINRAAAMNSLPAEACWEMHYLWEWFDLEPSLRVAIITGAGEVAFSAGMDLKQSYPTNTHVISTHSSFYPPTGFAGLTRREGKKPIIAAVNGHAHGGGFEIVLNSDLAISSTTATFCLPDVKRGTAALMGGLPRLVRSVGLQRAMGLSLLGTQISPETALSYGLIHSIVPQNEVIAEAVKVATTIAGMSPDSIVVTRAGILEGLNSGSLEEATQRTEQMYAIALMTGDNVKEGVLAFKEKRAPKWVDSKL